MAQLVSGVDAFGLIFDNLLGFDERTMRRLTALYALLYARLLISDSWTMTNRSFQAMLLQWDGVELLRGGIVVPVRRDTVGSFADFLVQVRAKQMHGLCAIDDFAAFLDRESRTVFTFSMKNIGAAYTAMAERVLAEEVLTRFGVSEASAAAVARLLGEAKAAGVDWRTNTWVKDLVCPQLPPVDAELVMEIARAPYSLNLPTNVLHSGIAGPEGFRGDKILAALRGETRTVASVGVAQAATAIEAAFHARVGDALVNWLLSNAVLEEMTAEDLARARGTSHRSDYLAALTQFLAVPNQTTWDFLVKILAQYLRAAAEEVFGAWRRSGRIQVDPPDGQIVVEGATTIRIVRPDRPVELSGISSDEKPAETTLEVEPVQVVGKTLIVPQPLQEGVEG